jgi:DeoR family transcriptional regulator of aga operon/DeoR family fructose operon transcriptional repressor
MNPEIRVPELSDSLGVSEATIRRDLDKLEDSGQLKRVHGGALLIEQGAYEPPVLHRIDDLENEKRCIGRVAADLIQSGDSVFIGSGTTTLEVSNNLKGKTNLTVVTNALTVLNALAQLDGISVISTGGLLRASELSFIGHISELALGEVRVDKVVIGIPAIDIEAGLTNDYLPEVMTDRTIINMAAELVVVADHSKFGKAASAYLAPIERIHTLVTDEKTDKVILEKMQELGITVVIAEEMFTLDGV